MGAGGRSAGGPSRERPRRRPEQVDGLLLVAERQRAGAALSAGAGKLVRQLGPRPALQRSSPRRRLVRYLASSALPTAPFSIFFFFQAIEFVWPPRKQVVFH